MKKLNTLDATMLVMGSMIGSGIFLVSAEVGRQLTSPIAWIMTWSTGNYPKWAGKFVLKTIRFWNRVNGYAFILVSDKYPSFGL